VETSGPGHVPVMLREAVELLNPRPGAVILDGTAGGGGHAAAILERIRPDGRLLLVDRDREALERLQVRFGRVGEIRYFHANFCDFDQVLEAAEVTRLDGALVDLGLASGQLAEAERGFSFELPGPLDMRMDRSQRLTADTIVNRWPPERLALLFQEYGDQPFSRRIAAAIARARKVQPVRRTDVLAEIISRATPADYRRKMKIHPATRVFQALRIAVNEELKSLDEFLGKVFKYMNPGGRVVVIAFHSGEDRLVKQHFREAVEQGLASLPVKKPLAATPQEVAVNPRSRSARMRVAERLGAAGG
jgi:16S rRNA (cytosine1402-N4)-methyltransferase